MNKSTKICIKCNKDQPLNMFAKAGFTSAGKQLYRTVCSDCRNTLNLKPIIKCIQCGKETKNKKFCCQSCAAIYNNNKREKRDDVTTQCLNCNKTIIKRKSRKYCDNKCQREYQNKNIIQNWLDGTISGNYGKKVIQTSKWLRKYLIEQANYKCSQCGFDTPHPDDGASILEVDHIDGDARNSRPENLRVVCPNCHALSSTYRYRNKNGTRRK